MDFSALIYPTPYIFGSLPFQKSAPFFNNCLIFCGGKDGFCCFIKATTPAQIGVAIDVPDNVKYACPTRFAL